MKVSTREARADGARARDGGRRVRTLVADIGGTNARFALADADATTPLVDDSLRTYEADRFPSLADAATHYLTQAGAAVDEAVIAVAGPLEDGQARITNLPWVIRASQLRDTLGLRRLSLVNDFVAQAMAVTALSAADVVPIGDVPARALPSGDRHGRDRSYAIIGPGTGLGVGGLLRRDGRYCPVESEGGHTGFAPESDEEIEVLRRLRARFGRISNERLVSGAGLSNLHHALAQIEGHAGEPLAPAQVSLGAERGDPLCLRAVALFCRIFGAAAGDTVLTLGAWDGAYLTGGLVPHLLQALQGPGFRQRFEGKGRLAPTMARVPVIAVVHPQPGLLGAAAIARAAVSAGPSGNA
ncbi:glucokinase [Marilutibacter maris]|uniref:Glucokinase n=1 Tax=Marilutibacter maris TaxID=1605891 RepID=A0A2U9T867_9GAMM|nr:glucokinase [Lysobacter maris]AWV07144.1 glucokinase [Lysobacter maris]